MQELCKALLIKLLKMSAYRDRLDGPAEHCNQVSKGILTLSSPGPDDRDSARVSLWNPMSILGFFSHRWLHGPQSDLQ